jgi:hypothetical protein
MTEGVFSIETGEDISGFATDEDMDRLSESLATALNAVSIIIDN